MLLLLRIDRYLRGRRMAPTRFGREAVGDPNLVLELRDGRQLRTRTAKRIEAALDRMEAELLADDRARETRP
jgi:hypothetical protein